MLINFIIVIIIVLNTVINIFTAPTTITIVVYRYIYLSPIEKEDFN